jgi:hypothetical protein
MTGKIFINYRRGDDPGHTGRLFDRLQDVFPPEQLFLDVDNIAPGLDFVRVLNDRVAECDIVLAVIGKSWTESRDASGNRRLDDPDDFVRIEITSALNQGKRVIPVLVGDAHMPRPEDLPEALQPLARRNAVRLTHERFRADTQGLIKAIQQGLHDMEAERQVRAEAERRAKAEEERRRQEEDAARRRQEEEKTKRRADAERAFAVANRTGTIAALDAFLAVHAESPFVGEARNLREALVEREDAFRRSSASNDPVLLRSFIETYTKGPDVRSARARLRTLEPRRSLLPTAGILAAGLGALLIVGASAYWLTVRPPGTSSQPAPVVTNGLPALADRSMSAVADADAKGIPNARAVDQVAWDLLKETTDEKALRRFIGQYPNSALRKDAEAQIASLESARAEVEAAAKAEAARIAEAARQADAARQAETTRREEAARIAAAKVLEEERAKAAAQEQQQPSKSPQTVALVQPGATQQPAETQLSRSALIQSIKMELARVGCYAGKLDDDWMSPTVKASIVKFVKAVSLPRAPDDPSTEFLTTIRNQPSRICPLECAKTEIESNGSCIAKTCPSRQKLDSDGNCYAIKQPTASRPSTAETPPKAKSSGSAGAVATGAVGIGCGRFGCKEHPVVNAPAGVPCKHAWQGKHGGWQCAD